MPELPEIRALAERLDAALAGRELTALDLLQFSSLKTFAPRPDDLSGRRIDAVASRG